MNHHRKFGKSSDKGTLHKTFFYKDSKGKRIPYKNKPNILEKRSVDGSTTISPAEEQQPADTENISALDQSSNGKVTNNSEKSYDKSKKLDILFYLCKRISHSRLLDTSKPVELFSALLVEEPLMISSIFVALLSCGLFLYSVDSTTNIILRSLYYL